MNYFKEEKEISIKELLYFCALRWRSIFTVALITAVCTAIANVFPARKYIDILGISTIVTAIVKNVVIATIVCMAFVVGIYIVKFLFTDTIKSVQEFIMICNMPILGCIPKEKKKQDCFIDKWLKKIYGVRLKCIEKEKQVEYIVKNIEKSYSLVSKNEKSRIVLVSSYSKDYAERVLELMADKISEKIEFVLAQDMYTSAESIDNVINADYIVFVEQQGKTKYYEFEQIIRKINSYKKNILGVILMSVDAI